MLKRQSPYVLVSVSALFCSAVVLLCVYLALHLPWLGLAIQYDAGSENWQLTGVHQHSSNRRTIDDHLQQQGLALPLEVVGIQVADKQQLFTQVLFIEEPDTLPSYAEFNQLMQDQQALFLASQKNVLSLITSDRQIIPLQTTSRPMMSLPALFWFQLFVGVGGALTGALVWASRRRDPAAILYALTGVGYLIFAPAAAIYSTRELIISGELFRILSAINHFGALFFTASLTSLLWAYPIKLGAAKVPAVIYSLALLVWLLNVMQWLAPVFMHLAVLLIFSISFVFSGMQWQKTRKHPSARAALRWFLLSIYTATGLFAGFIIIPAALHIEQPASQGIMFGAFLIMYWGLALGIVKYRLFQLEQWWHSITGWFVSGLFIVLFDIVLVSGLALPQELALPIALAIAGWLYFPVRQLLWSRIGKQANPSINAWIGNILPLLIDRESSESGKSSNDRWVEILRAVWRTPYVEQRTGQLSAPAITNDGLRLLVPAYPDHLPYHFHVDLPDSGARLFTSADIKTVKHLQQITGLALERIDARNQGIQVERDRIRRDMHDDLGATLLKLLHASPEETKPLVRNAITDMRQLVSTLEQYPVNKAEAIAHWHKEAEDRCKFAGATLQWSDEGEQLPELLSVRTYTNLSRILREAVSNALKYASPSIIHICFHQNQITLSNPIPADKPVGHGSGQRIMSERAAEINAHLEYRTEQSKYSITLTIPPEQG
jgi:signal transduction histidine kinase